MRSLPVLALLCACSTDGPAPTPGTDSTTPTGGTGGATTGAGAPGANEIGRLAYWWEARGGLPVRHALIGVFAPHFDGLAAPAPCAVEGRLCVAELPDTEGAWIEGVDTAFDPFLTLPTWVGDTIDVGGNDVWFVVFPDTAWGAYRTDIPGSALPRLDVDLAGEWQPWHGSEIVPVTAGLSGLAPAVGSYLDATASLDLAWAPSAEAGVETWLEVHSPTRRRLWRLADDGAASIPNGDLPPLDPDENWAVRLYRRSTTGEHDAHGNTVIGESWAVASWWAGEGPSRFSCKQIHDADPTAPSGVYGIQPDPLAPPIDVWCDMDADGGGWTQVASSRDLPVMDRALPWQDTLTTTTPAGPMTGVWAGLRELVVDRADLRFTCKKTPGGSVAVDLSFYDVGWYREVTTGSDADSCFSQNDGIGAGPPPARRNNLTGESRPAGDQWNFGYFEGEDYCDSLDDFTVDFDDRGKDSNQTDGTDWGEDDTTRKCANSTISSGGVWSVWVREP